MKDRHISTVPKATPPATAAFGPEQIKKARKVLPAVFGGAGLAFGSIVVFVIFPDEPSRLQAIIVFGFGIAGAAAGFILSLAVAFAKPKPAPARVVTNYEAAELMKFRETFASAGEAYARSGLRMLACFGLAVAFFFAMFYSPDGLKEWFLLPFGVCFVGVLLSLKGLRRACPACRNVLDEGPFGQYCPQCGSPKLEQPDLFRPPRCGACGQTMRRRRRGRHYKIRACTHCGVMLDEAGF
jgi:hypothetical protein